MLLKSSVPAFWAGTWSRSVPVSNGRCGLCLFFASVWFAQDALVLTSYYKERPLRSHDEGNNYITGAVPLKGKKTYGDGPAARNREEAWAQQRDYTHITLRTQHPQHNTNIFLGNFPAYPNMFFCRTPLPYCKNTNTVILSLRHTSLIYNIKFYNFKLSKPLCKMHFSSFNTTEKKAFKKRDLVTYSI